MLENDTTLCNPEQIYIHVADSFVYSGGYPSGTQFTWSAIGVPIVDLDSISSINGSSYSVIITLPNGCTSTSDTITVLTKSVAVVETINSASCVGGGSIEVTVTSGLPNYNYVWSTDLAQTNIVRNVTKADNQDTLDNIAAGTYYLQVYDEAGSPASCNSSVLTYVVNGANPIVASVTPTDITCNGLANGMADVTWTGGNTPYSITWSDGSFADVTPRTIALGGNYSVIVSDLSGCADTVDFTIVEPLPVSVTFTSTPESFPGALDGTVTAIPAGGTGPYTLLWADEFFSPAGSGNPLTGLAAGLYYGLVTDANSCDNSATVLGDSIRVDVLSNATLNLTVYTEGFYDGVSGLVPALLNSGVGLSSTECDTIYVELRDQLSPTTVLASGSAVLNTSGQATFTFPGSIISQNGYIAVFHRNAVQTWSDVVTFAGMTNYNFTTAATQAYGGNQVQVAPGVWAMYSGDLSPQDEFIDILDQGVIDNDIFNFAGGYVVSDLNGDGFVDIVDQSIVDNNIFNFIGSVHP
ncbi:MAG: SprB repeat-containing protein [Bacteroidetes bacterium]|nr:SprB repeat-containing protein [Bacteroidota bacterium]